MTLFLEPSFACSCGKVATPGEGLASSALVFEGQVLNTWPIATSEDGDPTIALRYSFGASSIWKGSAPSTIDLLDRHGNCAFPFRRGESYLVFAREDPESKTLYTTICDATRTLPVPRDTYNELGQRLDVSTYYPYRAESLAHLAVRRLLTAAYVERVEVIYWWRGLGSSTGGALEAYALMVLAGTYLALLVALAVRRRLRWVLSLATVPFVGALVGLARAYNYLCTMPGLARFME
ncbi:MAG: hypothetical protein U0X73_08450 [Thermoanaerobaculia bacterium]